MKTDYQRSQKFWIYVKSEQQSTKKDIKLTRIPWSLLNLSLALDPLSLLQQWPVTSYALKPVISLQPWKDVRHGSLKEIPFTELKGNYHFQRSIPGIPVMNHTHPNQTSRLFLLILLYYCQISMWQHSTMTRIYAGRSGVQILAEAIELSLLQNIQTCSSTQPASNSIQTRAFSLAVKWPGQTVWPLTSV